MSRNTRPFLNREERSAAWELAGSLAFLVLLVVVAVICHGL